MSELCRSIENSPKMEVAIGVVTSCNHYVLLQRKDGRWVFPGGKIEPQEPPETAVLREIFEETGLYAEINRQIGIHETAQQIRHYFLCCARGTPEIKEPEKFSCAEWVTKDLIFSRIGDRLHEGVREILENKPV